MHGNHSCLVTFWIDDLEPKLVETTCNPSSSRSQLQSLSQSFSLLATSAYGVTLPADYLELSLQGMSHLQKCGRPNVLYGLARGLGRLQENMSDSGFPARRMRMGLLQYAVGFFNADNVKQVGDSTYM